MPATKMEKVAFNEAIKGPKENIDKINKNIKELLQKKKKMSNIAGYFNLEIAMEHIKLVMLYLNMSDSSLQLLKVRNSSYLDNARKEFYKVVQVLEEIVGTTIDRPLVENKQFLESIDKVTIKNILHISKKMLFVFESLIDKTGESSKWKWSFVDLYVRVATVIKNLINFSEIEKYRRFDSEFFKERQELIKLSKRSLEEAAKQSRNKYDLSSQAPEDITKAIRLLSVLRMINMLFGESAEAEKTKNVIDALKARLEAEEKKKEKNNIKKK
jgi:hypothetical protein